MSHWQSSSPYLQLKDNPTLSSFFQGMSYSSFQKLADAYLETEALPTHNPPTVLPTAPELVKLAFTLDFTARIVGLSKQNIGHITGLGSRYLQDRFEYQQVRIPPVEKRSNRKHRTAQIDSFGGLYLLPLNLTVIQLLWKWQCNIWTVTKKESDCQKVFKNSSCRFSGMFGSSSVGLWWLRNIAAREAFNFSQCHRCGERWCRKLNFPF